MLNDLKMEIGAKLMGQAAKIIESGGFNNIKRGLRLVKLAVRVTPPCKELTEFGNKISKLVEERLKEK